MDASSRPPAPTPWRRRRPSSAPWSRRWDQSSLRVVDLDLSDEQRLIQETAREFVDREIAPRARENDRAARFDRELARRLGGMGYLGAPVPEEHGGGGADHLRHRPIVAGVGRGDSSGREVG